jgi:hypothetical protein
VKITMTCKRDDRDVMADLVIASGGHCPWDGEPFTADYAVTLVNALRDAQEAGTKLETALEQIADLRPEFSIRAQSVLADITSSIARLDRNLVQQG